MVPVIVAAAAALGAFGGIVWWGRERAKVKDGDTVFVPPDALKSAGPIPLNMESLSGLGGLVRVDGVTRVGPSASGTAGKELGVSVPLSFPVSAVNTIERKGQQFQNPEKA